MQFILLRTYLQNTKMFNKMKFKHFIYLFTYLMLYQSCINLSSKLVYQVSNPDWNVYIRQLDNWTQLMQRHAGKAEDREVDWTRWTKSCIGTTSIAYHGGHGCSQR